MRADRGGNGGTTVYVEYGQWWTMFPPTDGRGCPECGAIGNGGHGGGCPNQGKRYDEEGGEIA